MKLRSIPPANRQGRSRLDRLSSMRAATARGMVFIGSAQHQPQDSEPTFVPHVIKPDPSVHKAREDFQAALGQLLTKMEAFVAEAVNEEEAQFWRGEIERMQAHGADKWGQQDSTQT